MDKNGRAKPGRGLQNGKNSIIVQIPAIDVRPDLDAGQAQFRMAALKFPDREGGVLHRQRSETDESFRLCGDKTGDMVVEQFREIRRILRLRPVTEHDRDGRQDLHVDPGTIAVCEPDAGIPAVGLDLTKQLAVLHHASAARPVMFQLDKAAVAVAFSQVRPVFRKNVRMYIDLEHAAQDGFGRGMTVPQLSQVRFSSEP